MLGTLKKRRLERANENRCTLNEDAAVFYAGKIILQ